MKQLALNQTLSLLLLMVQTLSLNALHDQTLSLNALHDQTLSLNALTQTLSLLLLLKVVKLRSSPQAHTYRAS